MKKLITAAIFLLLGSMAFAEPIESGPRDPSRMRIWKSTNPTASVAPPTEYAGSSYLHQIIVSSPSASHTSTGTVVEVWGSTTGPVIHRVQLSTITYAGQTPYRWTYDTYLSSALWVVRSSETGTGINDGSAQIVFKEGPIRDFRLWQSSAFLPIDIATHVITAGPVLLHKVSVLNKGTGVGDYLRIFNSNPASAGDVANQIARINISSGSVFREYDFNVMLSSGLSVVGSSTTGTAADIQVFYKKNPPRDWEWWLPYFASGTVTTAQVLDGRGVFGGVLQSSGTTLSRSTSLTVFDDAGGGNNEIAEFSGAYFDFDDTPFDVHVTSGISVTATGDGQWTIRYRRLR